jgi:hypothetical protein
MISALPDFEAHRMLIQSIKEHRFTGRLVVVQREEDRMSELQSLGAVVVLQPMQNAIQYSVESVLQMCRQPAPK